MESGRKKNRAQLEAALDQARRSGAVLLIAKLDRLARNVAFTSTLMESGVEFIAADIPDANCMTLHVMAALAARKARGLPLGHAANLTPAARAKGPRAQREAAQVVTRQASAFALVLRQRGDTLLAIAERLNSTGHRTRRGGLWTPTQVKRILERHAE